MKLLTAIVATFLLNAFSASAIAKKPRDVQADVAYPVVPESTTKARTFYLENGLEVLAVHNPGSPMVGLNLLIRVGSAYEDYSTSGMSHMLEHLLFNGTAARTQEEILEAIEEALTG